MNPTYVPGPDDEYRGVVEIDCTEGLPEEVRAAIRPTRFIDDYEPPPVAKPDGSAPPPAAPTPTPPDTPPAGR